MKTTNTFLLAVLNNMKVNPSEYANTYSLKAIEDYRFAVVHCFDMMDDSEKEILLSDFEKITDEEINELEDLING